MTDNISFEGRVVVVTGGGRGMGRAHAKEYARRGASVVVDDYKDDYAEQVVAEILADGGRAVHVEDSVSTPEGGQRIIDAAIEHFGGVDVVVSNAAIFDADAFGDLTLEHIKDMHDTVLMGSYWVLQPAWREMMAKNYGRIVIVGSSAGLFGQFGTAPYGSAKGGLWGLMKGLAAEAEGTGIRVNLLLPGAPLTTLGEDAYHKITGRGVDFGEFLYGERGKVFDRLLQDPRRVDPSVNTHLVTYLTSEECELNGEGFNSAFGYYARAVVSVGAGWLAPDPSVVSAEVIRDHLDEICNTSAFHTPKFLADDLDAMLQFIDAQLSDQTGDSDVDQLGDRA